MAEPEIARRCPQCGATIRVAAFFCPQCGNELRQRNLDETQPLVGPAAEATITKSPEPVSDSAVEPGMEARKDPHVDFRNKSQKKKTPKKEAVDKAPTSGGGRARVGQARMGAVGAKLQRATTLARDVEGDVIQRVQKVREISSVVLDEAGDDPSLRFVLVAAVLFLVFLVIVLLNKYIS